MISAQIDELRAMAQLEKSLERPAIARILGDAADTITELRDSLQRANAENSSLQEYIGRMKVQQGYIKLYAENAKLREQIDAAHMSRLLTENENESLRMLADAVKEFVEDTHCEDCPCRRDCEDNNRIFCVNDFSYHAFAAMRELGIEVDE